MELLRAGHGKSPSHRNYEESHLSRAAGVWQGKADPGGPGCEMPVSWESPSVGLELAAMAFRSMGTVACFSGHLLGKASGLSRSLAT